jgi:hypothetical protein
MDLVDTSVVTERDANGFVAVKARLLLCDAGLNRGNSAALIPASAPLRQKFITALGRRRSICDL